MPIEINESGELIDPNNVAYGNLRSDGMIEIISRNPGFLEKWALLVILLIICLLFTLTWFINYPDVIKTRAILIASNTPKEIISHQDGQLVKVFVQNGKHVSRGDFIAFLESTGKHDQVIKFKSLLDSAISELYQNNSQNIIGIFSKNFEHLGEIQQSYQLFISAYQQFTDYLKDGYFFKKRIILKEDLEYLIKNNNILLQQKEFILKDLDLIVEGYNANEELYKQKVISKQDVRNERSKLISKQLEIPKINASLLNNEIMQREKEKEILELEHNIAIQKSIFLQEVQTLKSVIDEWEKKYIIKAPISGKLNFHFPIQDKTYLSNGKSLGFVTPFNNQFYAEATIPQYNFGKTDINQIVQLRFDSYPFQEFGYVSGRLIYISDIPTDSGYLAQIQLPFGLITNQKIEIKYREGLKSDALIITKDMSLIERIYYSLSASLNK